LIQEDSRWFEASSYKVFTNETSSETVICEACVDSNPRTIVPPTPPAITDNRDMDVFNESELNRDDQMTELDQSILHSTWVPTRYHQHTIDEREDRHDLRPCVPHDPRAGGSRPEN
jgi:hypothetical protein